MIVFTVLRIKRLGRQILKFHEMVCLFNKACVAGCVFELISFQPKTYGGLVGARTFIRIRTFQT